MDKTTTTFFIVLFLHIDFPFLYTELWEKKYTITLVQAKDFVIDFCYFQQFEVLHTEY
jgi:hypothetical protein